MKTKKCISRLKKTGKNTTINLVETLAYEQITLEDGNRCYLVDGSPYASVTTIMGWYKQDVIDKWINRVGEEEAERIKERASRYGSMVHDLCEEYIRNKEVYHEHVTVWDWFKKIEPKLRDIDNVKIIEQRLASNTLMCAGTSDCIAEYKGILSVIDYKTSSRIKKREWVDSYFMQTCFYAIAYYELTGIMPTQLVIIVTGDYRPQVFVENTKDWLEKTIKTIKEYNNVHNIDRIFADAITDYNNK